MFNWILFEYPVIRIMIRPFFPLDTKQSNIKFSKLYAIHGRIN